MVIECVMVIVSIVLKQYTLFTTQTDIQTNTNYVNWQRKQQWHLNMFTSVRNRLPKWERYTKLQHMPFASGMSRDYGQEQHVHAAFTYNKVCNLWLPHWQEEGMLFCLQYHCHQYIFYVPFQDQHMARSLPFRLDYLLWFVCHQVLAALHHSFPNTLNYHCSR